MRTRSAGKSSGQDKIYQMTTDRMLEQLRKGVVPWRKPWRLTGGGWPMNIHSKKDIGINPILLISSGHTSPWWGSFNQWAEACGMVKIPDNSRKGWHWESPDGTPRGVRSGETHTVVIFWKQALDRHR